MLVIVDWGSDLRIPTFGKLQLHRTCVRSAKFLSSRTLGVGGYRLDSISNSYVRSIRVPEAKNTIGYRHPNQDCSKRNESQLFSKAVIHMGKFWLNRISAFGSVADHSCSTKIETLKRHL